MANIRRLSAVDEIFQLVQEKIHQGEFPIGHVLPPQKIMGREYGVSASTIREALGKLTMLGYLSAKQGVGTTVISNSPLGQASNLGQYVLLNSSEVVHFMEARLCLEKAAIRSAAQKATDEDFARLAEHIRLQRAAFERVDSDLFSFHDKAFHLTLMSAGRNPILIQFLEIIQGALFTFIEEATRLEKVMASSLTFHETILDLLKKREAARAEKVIVEHLWDVARIVESNLGFETGLETLFKRELSSFGPAAKK